MKAHSQHSCSLLRIGEEEEEEEQEGEFSDFYEHVKKFILLNLVRKKMPKVSGAEIFLQCIFRRTFFALHRYETGPKVKHTLRCFCSFL